MRSELRAEIAREENDAERRPTTIHTPPRKGESPWECSTVSETSVDSVRSRSCSIPGSSLSRASTACCRRTWHVVGDVAGALFDLKTGNLLGAAQLGMEAMKDLPQATKSQQQQPHSRRRGEPCGRAPVPRQPHARTVAAAGSGQADRPEQPARRLKQLTALLGGAKADAETGADAPAWRRIVEGCGHLREDRVDVDVGQARRDDHDDDDHDHHARDDVGMAWPPVEAGATAQRATSTGWRGEPRTPAPATANQTPATPAPPTSQAAATPAPRRRAAAATRRRHAQRRHRHPAAPASTAPTSGETISSMAQLNSMSDSAIRDAVIHGRISPEVAEGSDGDDGDPAAHERHHAR